MERRKKEKGGEYILNFVDTCKVAFAAMMFSHFTITTLPHGLR